MTAGLCNICIDYHRRKAANPHYAGTAAYRRHKLVKDNQASRFREIHGNLQPDEAMIVMDFGSIVPLPLTREEMTHEWWNKDGVNDLIFTIYKRGSDGQVHHQFVHAVALSASKKTTGRQQPIEIDLDVSDEVRQLLKTKTTLKRSTKEKVKMCAVALGVSLSSPDPSTGQQKEKNKAVLVDDVWQLLQEHHSSQSELLDETPNSDTQTSQRVFHGHVYVRRAFEYLFRETNLFTDVKRLIIWSDGGPAHFKIRRSLFMMKEFAWEHKIQIDWHFSASNHGKGVCDGKHGVDKQMLRQEALNGRDIRTLADYIEVISAVANTSVVFEVQGAESNEGYNCTKFKEIKKYHEFIFKPNTDDIESREMSGQGEMDCQIIQRLDDPLDADDEEELVPQDAMSEELLAGMDEFLFMDSQLINENGMLDFDWLLMDPLIHAVPDQILENPQLNSE